MSSAHSSRPLGRPGKLTGLAVGLCTTLLFAGAGLVLANLPTGELEAWPVQAGRSPHGGETQRSAPYAVAGRSGTGAAIQQVGAPVTQTVRYQYDEAGRLAEVDYGGGARVVYTYDAGGNLLARQVTGATPPSATPTSGPTVATPTTRPSATWPAAYLPRLTRND